MAREHLMNTILAILTTLTAASLWCLGEHRVDVYISLYTLEYMVLKALFRPRRVSGRDWLALTLLTLFAIFVSWRVAEVLMY